MHSMNRFIRSLFLAAAMAVPALVVPMAQAQQDSVQVRVYDKDHRDYHNWDDHEDRAYRRYLAEERRSYREYHRQHHKVQRHYWNWRHSHPDRD
jgi:Ni/Co efflux regulator RcnB